MSDDSSVLTVDAMTIRFGGLTAVADVSLRTERGQVLGLIGPNGAGKSTFLNGVTGLYPLHGGDIHLLGRRLNGLRPHEIARAGIARTFQNLRLLRAMTVLENVMLGFFTRTHAGFLKAVLRPPAERAEELETRAAALELLARFGLDDRKDDLVASLPFAQQKSVELCRALAAKPALLLLDEPGGGMGMSERTRLQRMILELAEGGMSILLIEHDVELVMRACHRIVVLDHGRKIAEDTPQEVRSDPAVIAAYLGEGD